MVPVIGLEVVKADEVEEDEHHVMRQLPEVNALYNFRNDRKLYQGENMFLLLLIVLAKTVSETTQGTFTLMSLSRVSRSTSL